LLKENRVRSKEFASKYLLPYEKKYLLKGDNVVTLEKLEQYSEHVANKEQRRKYIERTSLNPTTKTVALVAGVIAIGAEVCQVIVAEQLSFIPADKASVIQKLQSNL
jgi:hypothetical protein